MPDLRRQAEKQMKDLYFAPVEHLAPENVEALVHELRVHQIELEMQCHELQRAQEEAEASRNRYRELYESLPIGYATLDAGGGSSISIRRASPCSVPEKNGRRSFRRTSISL